jgi:large subunit ribosomal protein L31
MAKANIHPNYQLATITCACGFVYETASTRGSFSVEICANCHPFYTGKQKLNDSAGRIERFQRRYQLKAGVKEAEPAAAAVKPAAEKPAKTEKPAKGEKSAKPEAKPANA